MKEPLRVGESDDFRLFECAGIDLDDAAVGVGRAADQQHPVWRPMHIVGTEVESNALTRGRVALEAYPIER